MTSTRARAHMERWSERGGFRAAPTSSSSRTAGSPDVARDIDAGTYLETLLVSAIASVLVTRLYLELADYPQLGGRGLHIAHLLWGGLLMLLALVMLLATLGKRLKHIAAIAGGLGFGLFLDELGKFITADNDYFFQPAIALIYIILVALFLVVRAIERRTPSQRELFVNAADHVREVVLDGATREEVSRGLDLLERSGEEGPLAARIRELLQAAEYEPDRQPSHVRRAIGWAWDVYESIVAWMWFRRAVQLIFVGQAALGVLGALILSGLPFPEHWSGMLNAEPLPFHTSLGLASVVTSLISLAFVCMGVARLPYSRISAYRWFERSLLVAILVTQVLLFWQDQLAALGGLFWSLALLTIVRSMIGLERAHRHR